MINEAIETFKQEAQEHLVNLEEALLEMDERPDDSELIDQAFRSMHTIKGGAGMFGFQRISNFTHFLETALDRIRKGEYQVSPEFVGVMLDSKDYIEGLLGQPDGDDAVMSMDVEATALLNRLNQIVPQEGSIEILATEPQTVADIAASDKENVYRIRFTPNASTFTDGFDVYPVIRELNAMGELSVTTFYEPPEDGSFDPLVCYLSFDVILVTTQDKSALDDTFIFVVEDWSIKIEEIDLKDEELISDQLGELLVERGVVTQEQLQHILNQRATVGEALKDAGILSDQQVNAALAEQSAVRKAKKKATQETTESIVKVPSSRLDTLMNLVGELVIVQARLNQIAFNRDDEELISVSEELDRLTTDMRDNTFSIRMLPIGTTFGRFRRLVRDLSHELGKKITLETVGAETELDKMVIDKLADPLVHLIRNSIDHGIEQPEVRTERGKPENGTVTLSASYLDSMVLVKIIDDGGGIDPKVIRDKAIEKGIISSDAQMSEQDILGLIFEAGFSTAQEITDISGRGVGMDVVKRSIQELGGKIAIQSELQVGTTFTISLPMTLAIIEGLMVKVGAEHYVLPLSSVEECIEMSAGDETRDNGKRLVHVRGDLVPFMHLREWFRVKGPRPQYEQVVITRLGDELFGFSVDEVVGQYQTVIKRLGKFYEDAVGFSGATILGDGSVAMILDPVALMDVVEQETINPTVH